MRLALRPALHLAGERRGSVAVMTAIMAPVMLLSTAMGIEVAWWSTTQVELQRVADIAAWGGAAVFARTSDAEGATVAAASMAELNGVAGATSRTWTSITKTLVDGQIRVQIVAGPRVSSEDAVKVTVRRSIPTTFSRLFPGVGPSMTITADAVAEIGIVPAGPQPCMMALGDGVDGITTGDDTVFSGNVDVVVTGCSIRSNAGIRKNGNGTVEADAGIYAGGAISGIAADNLHEHAGQIPDPYEGNAAVQNAISRLSPGSGTSRNVQNNEALPLSSSGQGVSSSWTVKGNLTLAPGLYVVNGPISIGAGASVTGSGVTIVTSGDVTIDGHAKVTLTAATTANAAGGAIPGVVFAGTSAGSVKVTGTSTSTITGLVYFPNADLRFSGTSNGGTDGCLQVIASTIVVVGTTDLASRCEGFGLIDYGSLPSSKTVALVQ